MFKYSRTIYYATCSVLFCFAVFILPCLAFKCIHDEVIEPKRTSGTQVRSVKYQDIKNERENNPKLYEPLKIHFYADNFNKTLSLNAIYNIDRALTLVRKYISKTFQVRKRKIPFLLERQSCTKKWQYGLNKGKCSKSVSSTEKCSVKETSHVIPDRFLDKLEVYGPEDYEPHYAIGSGPGLLDSNFITFITGHFENYCLEKDVYAFGSHCRLDLKTNEPLAGIINFCPNYFNTRIFSAEHYYNVILHEMFHILGFSFTLFEKFLPCKKGIYCDIPKNAIQMDSNQTARLMFPLVIEQTQKHFGCSQPDFGGPMAKPKSKDNTTSGAIYTSHWHPLIMYSSIMMPAFTEFDKLFVDNITLATFASTGWYRINFTHVDNFNFGRGEGCDFGISDSCENSLYLCNPSKNVSGCDLDHRSIGRCTRQSSDHSCGVFQPYTQQDCESHVNRHFQLDFYALGYKQKCIIRKEQNSTYNAQCLPIKCRSNTTYEMLINMTWYPCYYTDSITVNNVTYLCPESYFCAEDTQSIDVLPVLHHFCPKDQYFFIAVRMYFSEPLFDELLAYQSFKNFKVTAIRGIANKMKIPVNYLANASLNVFKKTSLDFIVCPPVTLSAEELNKFVLGIQNFLDKQDFLQVLKGHGNMIIASFNIKIEPMDVISFSDHEGFRALLIFPVICGIFLLATFVASILRLFLIQRHRPQKPKSEEALERLSSSGPLPEVKPS